MRRLIYVGWRLVLAVPVLACIALLNFALIHLAPGDPASVMAGEGGGATPEYMVMLRHKFGLDQSLPVQLWHYVANVATFDLGYSFRNDETVANLILGRLGPTLLLMGTAFVLSVSVGMLLGLLAGTGRNAWRDVASSTLALLASATPSFWLGLMLIVLLSIRLGWLPTSGFETVGMYYEGSARVLDIARHLIMPALSLALFYLALYTRVMRASVIEQFNMDYVTTARAKGQSERGILFGHILRNAMLPVVTMAGVQAANLIGGAVVVESVFGWPGIGTLAFSALQGRDLNLLLGIFLVSACVVVVTNLVVDLVYVTLDPRMDA
ncbi:MAG: transporter permease [Tardiphaga sp.]|jgi:peptide/nickel transport system permease protein|nr:transporter permease [Tardiphaga sp.]